MATCGRQKYTDHRFDDMVSANLATEKGPILYRVIHLQSDNANIVESLQVNTELNMMTLPQARSQLAAQT